MTGSEPGAQRREVTPVPLPELTDQERGGRWSQFCSRGLVKPLGIPSGEMLLSHPREQGGLPGGGDASLSPVKSEAFLLHSSGPSTVAAGESVVLTKPQEAVGHAQVNAGLGKPSFSQVPPASQVGLQDTHGRYVADFHLHSVLIHMSPPGHWAGSKEGPSTCGTLHRGAVGRERSGSSWPDRPPPHSVRPSSRARLRHRGAGRPG